MIAEKVSVPVGSQEILAGFPPKPLDVSTAPTVGALGIQNGYSLTVRQLAAADNGLNINGTAATEVVAATAAATQPTAATPPAAAAANAYSLDGMSEDEQLARAIAASLGHDIPSPSPSIPSSSAAPAPPPSKTTTKGPATLASLDQSTTTKPNSSGSPVFEPLPDGKAVVRRIVADDNSCLFSAVGYVSRGTRSAASSLRSIVATAVLADPIEWNEAVLGKDPEEYATWIQDPRRWGGAIELSILSKHLRKEVAAFDIQTQRVDVYGHGEGYTERVMVVYDGLHYDALAVAASPGAPESKDVTSLRVCDPGERGTVERVMEGARRLVAAAHASRQFTDTANFTLRCSVCRIGLRGEKEAMSHAQSSGHSQFEEY